MLKIVNFWSTFNLKRFITSGMYGMHATLPQLLNLVVSILAIRLISDLWWGQFLTLSIAVNLISMITSFGNSEYLIREWSRNPQQMGQLWLETLISRLPLLILCIPLLYIFSIPTSYWPVTIFWIFSEFLFKSFHSLIQYDRKFVLSIILNTFSAGSIAIIIITNHLTISVLQLVMVYGTLALIKALLLMIYTKVLFIKIRGILFNFSIIITLAPFFFPAITGFLQARISTYVVAHQMSPDHLAQYHPLLKLFHMMHSLAFFAIAPFMKNIYRLSPKSIKVLSYRFSLTGILGTIAGMFVVYLLMRFYFRFHFPVTTYLLGYFYMIPLFIYYIPSILLIKHNKQMKLVIIGIVATFINFLLSIMLLKIWGLNGALTATVVTQWFTMITIKYSLRKTLAQL